MTMCPRIVSAIDSVHRIATWPAFLITISLFQAGCPVFVPYQGLPTTAPTPNQGLPTAPTPSSFPSGDLASIEALYDQSLNLSIKTGSFKTYKSHNFDPFPEKWEDKWKMDETFGIIQFGGYSEIPSLVADKDFHDGYYVFEPKSAQSTPDVRVSFKAGGEVSTSEFQKTIEAPEIGYPDPAPGKRSIVEIKSDNMYFFRVSYPAKKAVHYGKFYIHSLAPDKVVISLRFQKKAGMRIPIEKSQW